VAGCPDDETLEEFAASASPSAEVRLHLERCATCRGKTEEIRTSNRLLAELGAAHRAAAEPLSVAPPEIEGYRVLAELHRGGQGVVFSALQLSTGRKVAVKVLLEGALASPRTRARFEREIATVVGLRHPHLVTVFDSGATKDGRRFFAMELVDGVSLDRHFRGRSGANRDARAVVEFFLKIVAAVHHAHQNGVIHRDLKPGNVLVDATGEPRVVDFGLAKPAHAMEGGAAEVTRPGWFLGTLAYAAPEQLRDAPEQVDVRADVYALGVMLFELLVGAFPYRVDGAIADVVRSILESEPAVPRGFDDELAAILRRALAKSREARYDSARDLARDLERWLRGEAVEAKRGRFGYLLRTIVRRNKLRFAAAAAVAVALVGAAVVSTAAWKRAQRDAEDARLETKRRTRIDEFVGRMFSAIDPENAQGRTVAVREVLDAAGAELERERIDEPLVEAELRMTIGKACASVGEFEAAQRHFERALALLRAARGGVDGEVATCMGELGNACFQLGQHARAEELDAQALAWTESRPLPDRARHAVDLKNLAQVKFVRGDFAAAEPMLRRAIALWTELGAGEEIVRSKTTLAQLCEESGRLDEAEREIAGAYSISREFGGPAIVKRAEAAAEFGAVALKCGRLDEACDRFAEAHDLFAKLFGEGSRPAVVALTELAVTLSRRDGPAAAATPRARAREQLAGIAKSDLPGLARVRANLGILALEAGDLREAERELRAAVDLYEQLVGRSHRFTAVALANLAVAQWTSGDLEEADRSATEARALLAGLAARDDGEFAGANGQLAWIELERGDPAAAEAHAREALALLAPRSDAAGARIRAARATLAWILHARGDDAGAEELLVGDATPDDAAPDGAALGRGDFDEAHSDRMLAEVLRVRGRPAEAERRYCQSLALQRRRAGAEGLELALTLDNFGWFLCVQRRFDEAGPPLQEALAIRRRIFVGDHVLLGWSVNNAAAWHYCRGEFEAARSGFEEAVAIGRRILPDDDLALGTWIENLASALVAQRQYAAAEPLLEEAHAILVAARGEEHAETKKLADLLATVRRQLAASGASAASGH
jgi:serine/threonine-protein kinase